MRDKTLNVVSLSLNVLRYVNEIVERSITNQDVSITVVDDTPWSRDLDASYSISLRDFLLVVTFIYLKIPKPKNQGSCNA